MTRFLLVGGGTAGHVNPLLATADCLMARDSNEVIRVLGTAEGLEARLVPERGYELIVVAKLPFPRRLGRAAWNFRRNFFALVATIAEIIRSEKIDVVVGFGGYVSAPAYLAARRVGVPIVVHEANAKPGMANWLGAQLTKKVGVTFAAARLPHARVVGMPLRREIETLNRAEGRSVALQFFGLDPSKPTLLVTGGSQGARHINEVIYSAATLILGAGWQILHLTGERSPLPATELFGYQIVPYSDRMDLALAACDLALARAGSATVSEFSALGVPAVYVPLSIGNGEQSRNAREAVNVGGALMVANSEFTYDWVLSMLIPLLQDRARVAEMSARALSVGIRDGAHRLVALIDEALTSRAPDAPPAK